MSDERIEFDELDAMGNQVGVHRFEYNASVRKWKYLILLVGFVIGVLKYFQQGHFDVVFYSGLFGFFAIVVVVSELVLRSVRRKVVEIDFDRHEVRLEYFVYPEFFCDIKRKPMVVIPFDEVLSVRCVSTARSLWEHYCVDTARSRFAFQDYLNDHHRLVIYLKAIASRTESSPLHRSPYLLGFIAGLIAFGLIGILGYLLGWI